MLHQTLFSSFRPFSPERFSPPFVPSAGRLLTSPTTRPPAAQVEMEDVKDRGVLAGEADETAWAAERVSLNLLAEEFQVDDLLDLRGLPESEEEEEDEENEAARVAFPGKSHSGLSSCVTEGSFVPEKELLPLSEISLPEETDAADLEWLSRFVDDCHSEFQPQPAPSQPPTLRNWSSAAGSPPRAGPSLAISADATESTVPVKAKRSKRSRGDGAVWSLSYPPVLADSSPVSSVTTAGASSPSPSSSCSSSSIPSYICYEPSPAAGIFLLDVSPPPPPKKHMPKKRGRKPKYPSAAAASGERRCTHCGVEKTPQWRAGPHGAKTLCNACGVRFKSGRLLPEYRPACSPTFVSSVHSNSHRKVLEMRRMKDDQLPVASAPPVPSC